MPGGRLGLIFTGTRVAATAVCAAVWACAGAQTSGTAKKPSSSEPKPHNRFVTVAEFRAAKRAPGANVSVEGYIVIALKAGRASARLYLVDSTDKVLSAKDADASARSGAVCTIGLGGKARPRWIMARRGLLKLAMYTGGEQAASCLQDTPHKVRIQGRTTKTRSALGSVAKIEFQDDDGEWRDFR
jgi:hypothetical protein